MLLSPSLSSIALERRRHQRKTGDGSDVGYFTVAGLPARLVDWSFGGIGVTIGERVRFTVEDAIELRVYDPGQECWETLEGRIRRIEPDGTLGISFADDGENTVRVLLHLLSNRIARTLS